MTAEVQFKDTGTTNPFANKLPNGVIFYFRNNSTGNATLKHIINDATGKTFCGFIDDACAEVHIDLETYEFECCKKCLKYSQMANK